MPLKHFSQSTITPQKRIPIRLGNENCSPIRTVTGLKRTGKSCRLRWLNYLRPDVRRGNITLQEQLLILELHSRWGNRWSKIAQYLPGRTDNEIKNYWRTRVQKQAKQLKCDVNSKKFREAMRYIWIPRLVERIQATSGSPTDHSTTYTSCNSHLDIPANSESVQITDPMKEWIMPEPSGTSSESLDTQVSPVSDVTEYQNGSGLYPEEESGRWVETEMGMQNNSILGGESLTVYGIRRIFGFYSSS
ncbi:hypothetical protein GH714_037982 [Hevea brasiliensis]|uniref:Uncharacterized protein n=1 Tax=Hevea brasiliensis TaxID=3981 RepID=A0A6A6LYM9_HEVBR|nr:hypothetical protein GH714_037982 [Hevea brasiliensis]